MATRPFLDTLREIEGGNLLDELSEIQHDLLGAIQSTNKEGEITIKLKYKPDGHGQMFITAETKTKEPKFPRGKSLFFITSDNNLSRQDPRQSSLDLRRVEIASVQPKEISNVQ